MQYVPAEFIGDSADMTKYYLSVCFLAVNF